MGLSDPHTFLTSFPHGFRNRQFLPRWPAAGGRLQALTSCGRTIRAGAQTPHLKNGPPPSPLAARSFWEARELAREDGRDWCAFPVLGRKIAASSRSVASTSR